MGMDIKYNISLVNFITNNSKNSFGKRKQYKISSGIKTTPCPRGIGASR